MAGVANVAGYAVASAAGSAASQGVAIAIGQQQGFSWEQVAASALTAGILKGTPIGELGSQVGAHEFSRPRPRVRSIASSVKA